MWIYRAQLAAVPTMGPGAPSGSGPAPPFIRVITDVG
jgi:hypothetical protein